MSGAGATAHGLHVDSAGSGPPLVLLHGWALHGGLFAPLVPALARRFRVHVVDLPGHGHSPAVDPYTLDGIVARLDDRFARAAPLTVLGWSLGGTVALRWALRAPVHVARLVLVCATPRFVAADGWAHAMAPVTLARFADELRVAYRATLQRFLTLQVQGSDEGARRSPRCAARCSRAASPHRRLSRRRSTCSRRPICATRSRRSPRRRSSSPAAAIR